MGKVIEVDFKKKTHKVREDYKKYTWVCSCCNSQNKYDSREFYNLPMVEAPMTGEVVGRGDGMGKTTVRIKLCGECITAFSDSIK